MQDGEMRVHDADGSEMEERKRCPFTGYEGCGGSRCGDITATNTEISIGSY